jgi:hypothetical protein
MPMLSRALHTIILFARVQGTQPSTWRGLTMIASACGIALRPDVATAIVAAGMAISGLIGVLAGPDAPPAAGE